MKAFSELPICPYLKDRLSAANFVTPTAVQDAAIPIALEGKDILATAQTGTGKTLAFLVPIMEQMIQSKPDGVQALVLVPTRELALQVGAQYDMLRGKKLPAPALVVAGLSEQTQVKASRAGARLVVATAGRLEDFMDRRMGDLRKRDVMV